MITMQVCILTSYSECIVHDKWNAMIVCDLRESRQVCHDVLRIADAFDVQGLGLLIDSLREVLWLSGCHKLDANAKLLEEDCGSVTRCADLSADHAPLNWLYDCIRRKFSMTA